MPKKRALTQAETEEVLSLSRKDIDAPKLRSFFAATEKGDARFNTFDTITIPIGKMFNKTPINTTIGRYIVNFFCFPLKYIQKYGFFNNTIKKGEIGKIDEQVATMLFEDEISVKEYCEYLDNSEWLGMNMAYYINPSLDFEFNKPIPEVIKRRNELFAQNADAIEKGDIEVAGAIQKELMDLAKEKLKEKANPSYDYFIQGTGKTDLHYRKSSMFGGIVKDPFTGKYSILKSNYMDGIDQKEMAPLANLTILGGYSRGVSTQAGGYEAKKVRKATQSIVLDEKGTDCGTNFALNITIDPSLKSMFTDRYIIEDGKLKLITNSNIDSYVGKKVLMRSPMYCKGDKICNKCAGEFFYKLGIKNAGLLTDTFAGSLLNMSMKTFHDSSVRFRKIDLENFIKEHK